jgi:hypothetical protein
MVGHEGQRVGPLKPMHGILYPVHPAFLRGREDKVGNNLSIGGGMKGIARVTEFLIEVLGINDVTVVGDGKDVFPLADNNGLGISYPAGTSGGIAVMTNSDIAGEVS